MPVGKKPF